MRLDVYLAENGMASSRQRAKTLIEEGKVFVDGNAVQKPAFSVEDGCEITVQDDLPYVGRGGLKLEAALDAFHISPIGAIALDIGASTGGFTDCLLQRGAKRVYAVDSGVGQLAKKLLEDPRVISMEQTNARALTPASLQNESVDLIVMDVSFISATYLIPLFQTLLRTGGQAVCLIKPQFEVGRSMLGKGGIVKEKSAHRYAVERVLDAAVGAGLTPLDLILSPIAGGDGNREFLVHFINQTDGVTMLSANRITQITGAVSHWREERVKC